ncbi:unnamed protein product [Durusdinium trenchii]|uniref:Uncharacterized protein n=1 Tax=Durusdinium trenchii TaxID=1381693 RepID=A0ABP0LZ34_9DINO
MAPTFPKAPPWGPMCPRSDRAAARGPGSLCTGRYVKGWRKWSDRRQSWVAIFEFEGRIWRKNVTEEKAPRTAVHVDPLLIEYQAAPICCRKPSGCSDSESEADANAGLQPGDEEEDNTFVMARELKYHLQLTSEIVGMARQTDLCRCDRVIGRWDFGEASVDSMGRLCTEISWWLNDEAANDRYERLEENWEMLLAVWEHLLCFHLEELQDCGFDQSIAQRFLERCLHFRIGEARQVKGMMEPLVDIVAL